MPTCISGVADDNMRRLGENSNVKYIRHLGRSSPNPIEQLLKELGLE